MSRLIRTNMTADWTEVLLQSFIKIKHKSMKKFAIELMNKEFDY